MMYRIALVAVLVLIGARSAPGQSTVDTVNRYNYAGNVGWLDWRADGANGAVFSEGFASGYVYGANIGWVSLGDGSPTNGTAYSNMLADDFGVNIDASSDEDFFLLSGYAYSANCGWIQFDTVAQTGEMHRPRIEKLTGILRGFAYSANFGWILLDSPQGIVETGLIQLPPTPTPSPTASPTMTPTATMTPLPTPTSSPTPSPTGIMTPTGTPTLTVTPTSTSTATATATATSTSTATPTATATTTPTTTSTPNPANVVIGILLGELPSSLTQDFNNDSIIDVSDHITFVE